MRSLKVLSILGLGISVWAVAPFHASAADEPGEHKSAGPLQLAHQFDLRPKPPADPEYDKTLKHFYEKGIAGQVRSGTASVTSHEIHFFEDLPVTDADFLLLKHLNPITRLYSQHPAITAEGLAVLKNLHRLQQLSIGSIGVSDDLIASLADSKNLQSLGLNGPFFRDGTPPPDQRPFHGETLGLLQEHKYLTELFLSNTSGLSDAGMQQLGSLPAIEWLVLTNCGIRDSQVRHLAKLWRLNTLSLQDNPLRGSTLNELAALPKLGSLNLKRCHLRDHALAGLEQLRGLHVLYLDENQIGDQTLERLADGDLKSLQALYLNRTNVTDEGLHHLPSWPALRYVELQATRVTGAGAKELGRLPNLVLVDLSWTDITDENAEGLIALKRVRTLRLTGNRISDEVVPILAQLKGLKNIELSYTDVSKEGKERLRKALPGLKLTDNWPLTQQWRRKY